MPAQAGAAKARGSASKFFREVKAEMRKVAWPSRKETLTYTWVVIMSVILIAIFIGLVDGIFGRILKLVGILGV